MTLETTTAKVATDTTRQAVKAADSTVKKIWSILDAASDKKTPSEYLSKQAVRAIQGNT